MSPLAPQDRVSTVPSSLEWVMVLRKARCDCVRMPRPSCPHLSPQRQVPGIPTTVLMGPSSCACDLSQVTPHIHWGGAASVSGHGGEALTTSFFDVIQLLTTLREAKTSPKLARKSEDVPEPLFSLRFANRKESVNSGLAEREGPAGGVCSQLWSRAPIPPLD